MEEKLIGQVTHYYGKIGVAIVELTDNLRVGDKIHIKGSATDFEQEVNSIQIEHQNVPLAKKGSAIGLKVENKVREGDRVCLVLE